MRSFILGVIALISALAPATFAQTPPQPIRPQGSLPPLYPPGMPNPLEASDVLPASEVASAFGLKGHLASDCSTDASKPGHVEFTEQADGTVTSIAVDPDGSRVRTVMLKGKQLEDGRVEFLGYASYNGPPLKRLVWKKDGNKFRFVSSQALNGAWLIRDSKFGDRVWDWITPCEGAPSGRS